VQEQAAAEAGPVQEQAAAEAGPVPVQAPVPAAVQEERKQEAGTAYRRARCQRQA
jgi:hypothetical protein